MKSIIHIAIALLLIPIVSFGQNKREIKLSYDLKDFNMSNNDKGQLVITTTKYFATYKSDLSAPAIPYIGFKILVSPTEEYIESSVDFEDVLVSENVELSPNPCVVSQLPIPESTYKMDNIVFKDSIYPKSVIEYCGTGMMGGYKMLTFSICPFKYDAANKRLYFKNNIIIKLSTNGTKTVGNYSSMANSVKQQIVNADEMNKLYRPTPTESIRQVGPNFHLFEYLIVTCDSLKPAFQILADWKTLKGVPTKVITTEEISSNYTENDTTTLQMRIKEAIKSYYDSSFQTLTYVLLGGDVEIVPAEMCYIKYWHNTPYTIYEDYTPTDLFYGCFDTMDWDSNGNGIKGEICDNIDILPDVFVSRASVRNNFDADVFVNRVISYESNPIWCDNAKKMLMAGTKTHTMYYANTVSDAEYKSDWLYDDYVQPYWSGASKLRLYDTNTDFTGGSSYDFNTENFQEQLKKGYGFVHVASHGDPLYYVMEPIGNYYDITCADLLKNRGETIILTAACYTSAFDSIATCLGESLLRNAKSGILSYVGSSRYSWYIPNIEYLGPSNTINGKILNKIFTLHNNNFSRVVMEAKSETSSACNTYEDMYRWLVFSVNPLGDPEMPIFTDTPQRFENINLSCNEEGCVIVNTNLSGCRICITGRSNTTFLVERDTNTLNWATLLPGDYNLCITKPGYIPYYEVFTYDSGAFIQKEKFFSDFTVNAPNVYIGKDVTTAKAEGPVTLNKGKMKVKLNNGVTIKNSFEVKKGASLEIQ